MNDYGLIPISSLTLRSDVPLGTDVFTWQSRDEAPILFVAGDQTIPEDSIQRLAMAPEVKLFIGQKDLKVYQDYLRHHVAVWSQDDSIPARQRAAAMAEVVRNVLSQEFQRAETDTLVASVSTLGTHMAQFISDTEVTGSELCRILHHDYGTFTHSANVGFYATLLAASLGYSAVALADIATGGLLHDLGKLDIDDRILNKPGRLDEFERRIINTHPLIGFRRLTKVPSVTSVTLLMTYQHHERIDGRGYPVGIGGEEIDIVSRICSVADVFEALTSHRPYRGSMSQTRALEIMAEDVGAAFDKEVFQCWSHIVKNRLSN